MRWIVMTLLLLATTPVMAQLEKDPENAEPVNPDPTPTPQHAIPPSQINADQAVVSSGPAKPKDAKTGCSDANPCATPTPESR